MDAWLCTLVLNHQGCLNGSDADRTVARKSSLGGFTFMWRGFTFVPGGLDIENSMKSPLICSVSYSDLGELGTLFGGAKPTIAPPWRQDWMQIQYFFVESAFPGRYTISHYEDFQPRELGKLL